MCVTRGYKAELWMAFKSQVTCNVLHIRPSKLSDSIPREGMLVIDPVSKSRLIEKQHSMFSPLSLLHILATGLKKLEALVATNDHHLSDNRCKRLPGSINTCLFLSTIWSSNNLDLDVE